MRAQDSKGGPLSGWAPSINPDGSKRTVEWTKVHGDHFLVVHRFDKDWYTLEVFKGSGPDVPVHEQDASSETAIFMKAALWIRAHYGPSPDGGGS